MRTARGRILLGALLIQPCLGAIYGWGAFVPALKASRAELTMMLSPDLLKVDPQAHAALVAEYRVLQRSLAAAQGDDRPLAIKAREDFLAQLPGRLSVSEEVWAKQEYGFSGRDALSIFSTGLMVFSLVMIVAGRWQDRVGPRPVAICGGLVLAAGYALAAISGTNRWGVLASIGIVGGAGIGLGYVCPIAACLKWFPDRKGLITGLAVAGFGGGSYLFIKLAGNWGGLLANEGVAGTFWVYSAIFAVVVSAGALLLRNPPEGWSPPGWQPAATASRELPDFDQSHTLRTATFWMLWAAFLLASSGGLMVIGSLKDFGIREGGLSESEADSALALLALFNALGRIVWGSVSQRLGAKATLALVSFLQALMMAVLIEMGSQSWTLGIAACWVGFHFGGNLALFPLLTAEFFGTRHLGGNYGLVFTAYGVGGVTGPMLAGSVWDMAQSYRWAFWPSAAGCLLAMCLALALRPPTRATS